MMRASILFAVLSSMMVLAAPQAGEPLAASSPPPEPSAPAPEVPAGPKFRVIVNGKEGAFIKASRDSEGEGIGEMYWDDDNEGNFDNNGFALNLVETKKQPICTISGTATKPEVVFTITDSLNYLDHCGPHDGITLTCTGPEAACAPA